MDSSAAHSLQTLLDDALAIRDKPAAVRAALHAVESGALTVPELYRLLGGLMTQVGDRWQSGEVQVWQEHLASATVRTIVEELYPVVLRLAARERNGRTVVLACPENESHDLGLRMLSDRFELAGWDTCYLGADTPAAEIAAAAAAMRADLIVLSVSTHFNRIGLTAAVDTIHAVLPEARVVVGGPAFRTRPAGDTLFDVEEFLGSPDAPRTAPRPEG
jgi:MerR family transcriptional regulator, light-induced transcriptional regulator